MTLMYLDFLNNYDSTNYYIKSKYDLKIQDYDINKRL